MHIRNRFAAVAPATPADLFEQVSPLPASKVSANAPDYEKPRDLWALRALSTNFGRAVGVRLSGGKWLKVAVVTAAGLEWLPAKAVLSEQQAARWARTGQFYKA